VGKKTRKPRARPPKADPEPAPPPFEHAADIEPWDQVPRKRDEPGTLDETFEQMLARLKITKWDLILVGDGSGSQRDKECGWAVTAIKRNSRKRLVFYGAMNMGSVNFAEMMAYLQPLTWYMNEVKAARSKDGRARRSDRHIHIITDSAYCQRRGDDRDTSMYVNKVLWGVFELINRQGFKLEWHWEKRETVALNMYADRLSKAARILIRDGGAQRRGHRRSSAYDMNPWE
jgi:hypothetical protein